MPLAAPKKRMAVLDQANPAAGLPSHPAAPTPWGLTDLPWKGGAQPYLDGPELHQSPYDPRQDDRLTPSPIPVPTGKKAAK